MSFPNITYRLPIYSNIKAYEFIKERSAVWNSDCIWKSQADMYLGESKKGNLNTSEHGMTQCV